MLTLYNNTNVKSVQLVRVQTAIWHFECILTSPLVARVVGYKGYKHQKH